MNDARLQAECLGGEEGVLLVAELLVEGLAGHAGRSHDVGHGRRRVTLLPRQLGDGGEDPQPLLLGDAGRGEGAAPSGKGPAQDVQTQCLICDSPQSGPFRPPFGKARRGRRDRIGVDPGEEVVPELLEVAGFAAEDPRRDDACDAAHHGPGGDVERQRTARGVRQVRFEPLLHGGPQRLVLRPHFMVSGQPLDQRQASGRRVPVGT